MVITKYINIKNNISRFKRYALVLIYVLVIIKVATNDKKRLFSRKI